MESWLEKHRPVTLDDYIGVKSQIKVMERFIDGWLTGERREGFLILVGPAGVGKTTFAHAVANDIGITMMEVNASDTRRKADLDRVCAMSHLTSYDDDGRLLLLDEADGIQRWDPLKPLLQKPSLPIIITANDVSRIPYDLRQLGTVFFLRHPPQHQRKRLIDRICEAEDLDHTERVKDIIAEQCRSWRSVINTLQTTPIGEDPVIVENQTDIVGVAAVRLILQGHIPDGKNASAAQVLRWGAWNMADPDTIQTCLMLQEAKKTASGVGVICDRLAFTLRVKGDIDAPEWRPRQPKKEEKKPTRVNTERVQSENKTAAGFGGFF